MYNVKHHTGYELEPLPGDSSFDKITNRSDWLEKLFSFVMF